MKVVGFWSYLSPFLASKINSEILLLAPGGPRKPQNGPRQPKMVHKRSKITQKSTLFEKLLKTCFFLMFLRPEATPKETRWLLKWLKIAPEEVQELQKCASNVQFGMVPCCRPQYNKKWSQDGPKSSQETSLMVPRWLLMAPTWPKFLSRWP